MIGTYSERKSYFVERSAMAAFDQAFANHVSGILKDFVAQFMSTQNTQRLRHGGDWHHPGLPQAIGSGFQEHTSEVMIKYQDIVDHDLGAIDRHVEKIARDMSQQFQKMMYTTVSAACDQTGNVVDANAAGGPMEAIANMLEKIQFSADKNGNVTLPQMHVGPEMLEGLLKAEKAAPPELLQRIQDTKARKIAEAIQEEARRKARFVQYGGEA